LSNHKLERLFSHLSFLDADKDVTSDVIVSAYIECPNSYFLTYTNAASDFVNRSIVEHVFEHHQPSTYVRLASKEEHFTPLFQGMQLTITENCDKLRGVVNGQRGLFHSIFNATIYLDCGGRLIPVHPVTDEQHVTYYPLRISYSTTISKVQGQTLPHITVWFDTYTLPEGCAYVVLSRIKSLDHLRFIRVPTARHFRLRFSHNTKPKCNEYFPDCISILSQRHTLVVTSNITATKFQTKLSVSFLNPASHFHSRKLPLSTTNTAHTVGTKTPHFTVSQNAVDCSVTS